jgi:ribonucleoside-diphosphate reductase alpha chain
VNLVATKGMGDYKVSKIYGPTNKLSDAKHAEKYRGKGESFREAATRVATCLSDNEEHFRATRDILLDMRFLPGGRIQTAIGSAKAVTPYNCYVSGTIEDTFTDGVGSIMGRAHQAAQTMRMGGGIGYDFSTLRPRGALIKKLQSNSGGPLPFMEIYDAICRATSSSGARRGAQMGVLRVDHPDIEEFIRAKQNSDKLTGFNISVAVTDKFMEAVIKDEAFDLKWGPHTCQTVRARDLWEMIMRSTFDWAEPGVLFIDRINLANNLYYCEAIAATNPCGEQPLPPFGACLLGSFNLVRYLDRKSPMEPWFFDYEQLFLDIPHVVRAMDNVVDVARYPLYEQEKEAHSKRRMGLGITGLANTVEALGHKYGTPAFIRELTSILTALRNCAYESSAYLAAEKGSFPLYQKDLYLNGSFISTLPLSVRDLIAEHGIRNSHLLSIAPTGTISFTADNVSSGIEPVFAYTADRVVIEHGGPATYEVQDYGYAHLGTRGRIASECTVDDHLRVLIACSRLVDSAVSKTCNVPEDISWEDFKDVYMQAWKGGCKGVTTYRPGGLRGAVLTAKPDRKEEDLEGATCEIDPVTGRKNCE